MTKRIIIKTILITSGFLLLIFSILSILFLKTNELDTEQKYEVLVATKDIGIGDIITETMVTFKTIKESSFTKYMITKKADVINKTVLFNIPEGEYISTYSSIYKTTRDEEKIIVLPLDVDTRLANLINKNSLVDIKVELKNKVPQVVVPKIKIEDIISENGISIDKNQTDVKKCFGKFILTKDQRDKIYVARSLGKLFFELYIDSIQKPPLEEFKIPLEFLNFSTPAPTPLPGNDKHTFN